MVNPPISQLPLIAFTLCYIRLDIGFFIFYFLYFVLPVVGLQYIRMVLQFRRPWQQVPGFMYYDEYTINSINSTGKSYEIIYLEVPTTQLAKMSIDPKFVELTVDVLEIFL